MFFLLFYVLALITASVHIARDARPRTRQRIVELFLLHLVTIGYGVGDVFAFVGHAFRADETARSIGWPTGNPFQLEIAFANLGIGVTGLLCAKRRGPFWTATALAASVFYVGAAVVHMRDLLRTKNVAINNIGAILPDLLTPATTLALLWEHERGGHNAPPPLWMGLGLLFRRHRQDPPTLSPALGAWAAELDAFGTTGYAALPLAEFTPLRRQDVAPAFFDAVAAPMDRSQEPTASATIFGRHDRVQVPTLNVGGWYDIFLADTITNFSAMRALGRPSKLLIGPWTHGTQGIPVGELNFGFGSQAALINLQMDLGNLQLRWFDHWLKGIDTGMMAEAPIRIFVMGENAWRDEQEWPLARAVDTPWYLHAGGELSPERPGDEAPDRYDYDPADPVPTRGGARLMTAEYPAGPFDQHAIEARPDVLVHTSQPLERDTEVTGPITVYLWAVSSAPDTDFVARLTDVFPDGRSFNLTDGIVRARYRNFAHARLA